MDRGVFKILRDPNLKPAETEASKEEGDAKSEEMDLSDGEHSSSKVSSIDLALMEGLEIDSGSDITLQPSSDDEAALLLTTAQDVLDTSSKSATNEKATS